MNSAAGSPRSICGRKRASQAPNSTGSRIRRISAASVSDGREEIGARGLPRRRRVAIREVPLARLGHNRLAQCHRLATAGVIECERQGKGRVRMHAMTDRIGRHAQPAEIALDDAPRQAARQRAPSAARADRSSRRAPARASAAMPSRSCVRRRGLPVAAGRQPRRRCVPAARCASSVVRICSASGRSSRDREQAHEQPMGVHARVPVKAAEECRMERARAGNVFRAGHDVVELVRVFTLGVGERHAGERRCLGLRQRDFVRHGDRQTMMRADESRGSRTPPVAFRPLRGSPSCVRAPGDGACGCGSMRG